MENDLDLSATVLSPPYAQFCVVDQIQKPWHTVLDKNGTWQDTWQSPYAIKAARSIACSGIGGTLHICFIHEGEQGSEVWHTTRESAGAWSDATKLDSPANVEFTCVACCPHPSDVTTLLVVVSSPDSGIYMGTVIAGKPWAGWQKANVAGLADKKVIDLAAGQTS